MEENRIINMEENGTELNIEDLEDVNGGAKVSYTVKCSHCKKSYTATGKYYGLVGWILMSNSVKIKAARMARDCEYGHMMDML